MSRALVAALVAAALAGCYHRATPPRLDETVSVRLAVDDARLVRAQAYLQAEVARALVDRLGWHVSPAGTARLELSMREETISTVGTNARDVPARWSVTLHGHALLTSRRGTDLGDFMGTGYASSLADEPAALQQAARLAAMNVATWLETAGRRWDPRPDEPGLNPPPATASPRAARSGTDSTASDAVTPATTPLSVDAPTR